jgi:UDP-N-acetylmuramoyl-L-alanyl-D-glutamate--2,6-diaminopimelate ligase
LKRLAALLPALGHARRYGPPDQPVRKIEFWADDVAEGDLFVAIGGHWLDGHDRIADAIRAGARTIVCERLPQARVEGVTYLQVPGSPAALGRLAHAFHRTPSERLSVVGVTGTNGKTSTVVLLHRLFRLLGYGAGLLSNIGDYVNDEGSQPRFTTGHALFLAEMMGRMAEAGCRYCFMEVSSQSVEERRTEAVAFAGGVFTNLASDHLHYHGTLENYAAAKKAWFDGLPPHAFALTNADDPRGAWMVRDTAGRRLSYGTGEGSDIRFRLLEETVAGLRLEIDGQAVCSPLLGAFNAYNLAAVYGVARELGEAPARVAEALGELQPVDGRMNAIRSADGRSAIIDYAHTPAALAAVLGHLRAVREPGAKIIVVVGCGGGGDRTNRPAIAEAAAALADRLILTSDNPRDEDPDAIIADMVSGLDGAVRARTRVIVDRRAAIETACAEARPGDVALIAGKGHERTQEIGGVSLPFDDAEVARAALGLSA